MSVLNQSGEEQVECPLCMEPLEVDDLNFYPCTCGYQICRFCWHRIRTDENGLCPACRKAYSENPADFTPLSKEQVAQLKAEKRQRDQQRKAKLSESRKHLASVRVVQKNLVFVVGLPVRLADADALKRHEYFGKFGKIHKVVINQSTSYAGSQGPSASAYVTYVKGDDALRAIQSVNNITLDGRLIKSSLGTTKYCSHFMKNQPCPKVDCMYLHDLGDQEASFTKEQMHAGKHQEYERKLHESLLSRMASQQTGAVTSTTPENTGQTNGTTTTATNGNGNSRSNSTAKTKDSTNSTSCSSSSSSSSASSTSISWPTLSTTDNGFGPNHKPDKPTKSKKNQKKNHNNNNNNVVEKKGTDRGTTSTKNCSEQNCNATPSTEKVTKQKLAKESTSAPTTMSTSECIDSLSKMQLDDNSSFFSHNAFQKIVPEQDSGSYTTESSNVTSHSNILNDNLPDISSTEDWEAAFGFSNGGSGANCRLTDESSSPVDAAILANDVNGAVTSVAASVPDTNGFVKLDMGARFPTTRESILDVLSTRSHYTNSPGFTPTKLPNGLDQQMSKFFAEFGKKEPPSSAGYGTNGFTHPNGYQQQQQQYAGHEGAVLLNQLQHHQRLVEKQQMDEQAAAVYGLKQGTYIQGPIGITHQHSYLNGEQFLHNGQQQQQQQQAGYATNGGFSIFQQNQTLQQRNQSLRDRSNVEDDLGFDPFHETQKALAELIESEQAVTQITSSGLLGQPNHISNGLTTSVPATNSAVSSSSCLPPPPPGFLHHHPATTTAHMNSFGSKILPFLNMASAQQQQQQVNGAGGSAGWTSSYADTPHQQQHLKGLTPVNDWMTLDPAIVSSSRHFPLANLGPLREQFSHTPTPTTYQNQTNTNSLGYEYQNNTTPHTYGQTHSSGATSGGYLNSAATNGLSWFAREQIASPPGFRQQSKSQEC